MSCFGNYDEDKPECERCAVTQSCIRLQTKKKRISEELNKYANTR